MALSVKGHPLVAGVARGELLVGTEPLSFWGGYNERTGEIIDRRHPLSGERAAGKILALPGSRGSSTTTAVLLEAIMGGVAPAGIVVSETDAFFALASIVGDEMFQKSIPVIEIPEADFDRLRTGLTAAISEDGTLSMESE